jgi:preprotein translocase subunit SecE
MAETGIIGYFKQVRSEMKKVTWPSRRETMVSTFAVFLMVFFASIFLYVADQVIAMIVKFVLSFGI